MGKKEVHVKEGKDGRKAHHSDAYQDLVSFMNLKNKNMFSIDEIKKWLHRG